MSKYNMATDVDVQFFSHLNGLTLSNNWGDMIRLLDAALVNGVSLPSITAVSIDAQGDVHLTLYANHTAMLFQIVELTGFTPESLNQKYRIKGVPSANQLILKPQNAITETLVIAVGTAKLASLGYDIIFRDAADVKRVYRAKNPSAQHPFIRIDESIASDTGTYTSTYAKYAMVGLLESMDHIDDYENPDVLQLPFDPSDPAKNWKITGADGSVVRGWNRWYWRKRGEGNVGSQYSDADAAMNAAAGRFTLTGDKDAFYLILSVHNNIPNRKIMMGCGLFDAVNDVSVKPNWFLGGCLTLTTAGLFNNNLYSSPNMTMLAGHATSGKFLVCSNNPLAAQDSHVLANCTIAGYNTGKADSHPMSTIAATSFPFSDDEGYLRGTLKHLCFSRKYHLFHQTTPQLAESSMYIYENFFNNNTSADAIGGVYFYIGELE